MKTKYYFVLFTLIITFVLFQINTFAYENTSKKFINISEGQSTTITINKDKQNSKWTYFIENSNLLTLTSKESIKTLSWTLKAIKAGHTKIIFTSKHSKIVYDVVITASQSKIKEVKLKLGESYSISKDEGGRSAVKWSYTSDNPSVFEISEEISNEQNLLFDGFSQHTWTFSPIKEGSCNVIISSQSQEIKYHFIIEGNSTTYDKFIEMSINHTTVQKIAFGGLSFSTPSYKIENEDIIKLQSEEIIPPPEGMYDGPSTKVYTFKAISSGITTIYISRTSNQNYNFTGVCHIIVN